MKDTQIDCKESGCTRKGYWVEERSDGERVFAFRTRHDGANHCQRFSLDEIQELLTSTANKAE